MEYLLISTVSRTIRVLKTPAGVQIWMKGKRIEGASEVCAACGKKIGIKPFFSPMAGEALPNPNERIHAVCMRKLALLPMVANTFIITEDNHDGKQN